MERPAPVRKSHTSTADLLIWPEGAPQEPFAGATPPPNRRPHQVSGPPVPHGAPRGLPASVVIVEGTVCLNFFFLFPVRCSRRRRSGKWCSAGRSRRRRPRASTRGELPSVYRARFFWCSVLVQLSDDKFFALAIRSPEIYGHNLRKDSKFKVSVINL